MENKQLLLRNETNIYIKKKKTPEGKTKNLTEIPSDCRLATAESTTCLRLPMMATEAPCLPNCVDISNPIPDPPPVIKATFPFRIFALNGDSI
jgi:hypothetical protein